MSEWQGEERRLHDRECDNKLKACVGEMKSWVREHVCLTIKPTKLRNTMLWSAIVTMLLTSGASIVKSLADTGTINHNATEIQEVKEDNKDFERSYVEHLREQRRVNEKILDSLYEIKTEIGIIKEQVE